MKSLLSFLILFATPFILFAQIETVKDSLNQEAEPSEGINALAAEFLAIDFSKEQREILKEVRLEFIFLIDKFGNPTLKDVNGIADEVIKDSLHYTALNLQPFSPRIRDGEQVESFYFLYLTYPIIPYHNTNYNPFAPKIYKRLNRDDFKYIEESNTGWHVLYAGFANKHFGKIGDHLSLGGGMKVGIEVSDKRGRSYGIVGAFAGNKLKKEFPIISNREQVEAPVSANLGLSYGQYFSRWLVQAELTYSIIAISPRLGENDTEWIEGKGVSPAITVNFPIRFGNKDVFHFSYSPQVIENNINFHASIRYLFQNLPSTSGLVFELGIGYRLSQKTILEYELKEGVLN